MKRQKMSYPILDNIEIITPTIKSGCKTINYFKFNLKDSLQIGDYAGVYTGQHIASGINVAIKAIPKNNKKKALESEIGGLRLMSHHPNIVDFYEVYQDSEYYYLIFGLMPCDLHNYINKNGAVSELIAKKVITHVGRAVKALHYGGIAHRDIKLENILVDKKLRYVQLCDLGYSRKISEEPFNDPRGSLYTVAPEIFNNKPFGSKVDIWALGCVLTVMLTGEYPCSNGTETDFQIKILTMTGRRYKYPDWFSNDLKSLLDGLLAFKPCDRFTIDQMMNHPWMQ